MRLLNTGLPYGHNSQASSCPIEPQTSESLFKSQKLTKSEAEDRNIDLCGWLIIPSGPHHPQLSPPNLPSPQCRTCGSHIRRTTYPWGDGKHGSTDIAEMPMASKQWQPPDTEFVLHQRCSHYLSVAQEHGPCVQSSQCARPQIEDPHFNCHYTGRASSIGRTCRESPTSIDSIQTLAFSLQSSHHAPQLLLSSPPATSWNKCK